MTLVTHCLLTRGFHKLTKLAILALLPSLYFHMFADVLLFVPVDVKLDVSGCERIIFQGCRLHCLLEGQNEVGSVGILLSLRVCENVYCVSHSNTELCSR